MIFTRINGKQYRVYFTQDGTTFIRTDDKDTFVTVPNNITFKEMLNMSFFRVKFERSHPLKMGEIPICLPSKRMSNSFPVSQNYVVLHRHF